MILCLGVNIFPKEISLQFSKFQFLVKTILIAERDLMLQEIFKNYTCLEE